MRWKTAFIALCCLAASLAATGVAPAAGTEGERCAACHEVRATGGHGRVACASCHGPEGAAAPADSPEWCARCHRGHDAVMAGPMAVRAGERAFVARTLGKTDPLFFDKACASCHVRGCSSCHDGGGHSAAVPAPGRCLSCHKGYFVGADYYGLAPREEHARFARGTARDGELYLPMLPDVHAEAGLSCGACHSMRSLAEGRKSSRTCVDCHRPDPSLFEHRNPAHRSRMECWACHSAWAAQEYGTFYIRVLEGAKTPFGALRTRAGDYVKSVYLKRQDAPPLGVNRRGKVSPIRPQFLLYLTDARGGGVPHVENRRLASSWRAFFPHTVRRGTVPCEGCHDNPARLMLDSPKERVHLPREDGLGIDSFWHRTGQRVENGSFLSAERVARMRARNATYRKGCVQRWKRMTDRVDDSSGR